MVKDKRDTGWQGALSVTQARDDGGLNQSGSSEVVGSGLILNIFYKRQDVLRAWKWSDRKEVTALT